MTNYMITPLITYMICVYLVVMTMTIGNNKDNAVDDTPQLSLDVERDEDISTSLILLNLANDTDMDSSSSLHTGVLLSPAPKIFDARRPRRVQ